MKMKWKENFEKERNEMNMRICFVEVFWYCTLTIIIYLRPKTCVYQVHSQSKLRYVRYLEACQSKFSTKLRIEHEWIKVL